MSCMWTVLLSVGYNRRFGLVECGHKILLRIFSRCCYGQIPLAIANLHRKTKTMITLNRKLKKEHTEPINGLNMLPVQRRISIRDKLLVKEVQEMNENLPVTCSVSFEDPNVLSEFVLTVVPDEGYWHGGKFKFSVSVTDDYNMAPPRVKCLTRLWHPNINVDGDICLSLLRQTSIDEHGWAPTRKLKDVVWGLNSLFTDLLNFEDPLNIEAAEMYSKNKTEFQRKVREYIGKNKR